jgi:hypothetical protein
MNKILNKKTFNKNFFFLANWGDLNWLYLFTINII